MARLLSIPAVVAIVAGGVWVTGAAITNDFRASMALTAVWFGLTGLACVLFARRSRSLRVPVLASYLATVAVGRFTVTRGTGPHGLPVLTAVDPTQAEALRDSVAMLMAELQQLDMAA